MMSTPYLTIIACILLPITIVIIVAVIGTKYRIGLARQLMEGAREDRYSDLSKPGMKKKIRVLVMLALLSLIGIIALLLLAAGGALRIQSAPVIISYLFFTILGTLSGMNLYKTIISMVRSKKEGTKKLDR